jgi:hypothetical protein
MDFKGRYSIFWDVTEDRFIGNCRRFGKPVGPNFNRLFGLFDAIYTAAGPYITHLEMDLAEHVASTAA